MEETEPGTFAIMVGIKLPYMPFNEMEFIELKRGSSTEIKKYGAAIMADAELDKTSLFYYPLLNILSTPEHHKTFTITGEVKGFGLKYKIVKVD